MTKQRPETLMELADDLMRRVKRARSANTTLVMLERWELESILSGEFMREDDDNTGDIGTARLTEGQLRMLEQVTARHEDTQLHAVRITTAEHFVASLDLEAVTVEIEGQG